MVVFGRLGTKAHRFTIRWMHMFQFSATVRIAIGLTSLGFSVLLATRMLGLDQGASTTVLRGRQSLAESIAMHCATAQTYDLPQDQLRRDLQSVVDRTEQLLFIGVRHEQQLVIEVGEHRDDWRSEQLPHPTLEHTQIASPVVVGGQPWGSVELRFAPLRTAGIWRDQAIWKSVFLALASSLLFTLYLRKMLSHLDPSKVIPDRVRAALDTLAEGMLVLDRNQRIVLANRAFAENLGECSEHLQGRKVSDLPWLRNHSGARMPWEYVRKDGQARLGAMVDLQLTGGDRRTYMVNASPIISENGLRQGVIASFDDVTLHEQRKTELERTLNVLANSQERIRQQNEELKVLATRDPLTGCLNRRSFFEQVEAAWSHARSSGCPMACVMIDVDHFKAINDRFGHSVGDDVLRGVGRHLQADATSTELLCRYGGEEFCLVLNGSDMEEAVQRAEALRRLIEQTEFGNHRITASLGVSSGDAAEHDFQELLERADNSLYVAKRRGAIRLPARTGCGTRLPTTRRARRRMPFRRHPNRTPRYPSMRSPR